jgi:hypothetical protein
MEYYLEEGQLSVTGEIFTAFESGLETFLSRGQLASPAKATHYQMNMEESTVWLYGEDVLRQARKLYVRMFGAADRRTIRIVTMLKNVYSRAGLEAEAKYLAEYLAAIS